MKSFLATCLALALALPAAALAAPAKPGDYVYEGDIDVGAPGFWDYVTLDAVAGRLCLGHVDKVSVIDLKTRKVIGAIGPMDEAHGVAILHAAHKGYATSGGDGVVKVFDLESLRILKTIAVGEDADGITLDAGSGLLAVGRGHGKAIVVIDSRTDEVVRTIALPDGPEASASDGKGTLYVNLSDSGQMAKIDLATGRIASTWPLAGCEKPHGLAYEPRSHRLFAGCANQVLLEVDPATGRILDRVPVGSYGDVVGLDVSRGRVFSPNGDGTLTVIKEQPGDHIGIERTIPTFLGGRTMAVDPQTGALFIAHGDTQIKGGLSNLLELRFGWDNARVAVFRPND